VFFFFFFDAILPDEWTLLGRMKTAFGSLSELQGRPLENSTRKSLKGEKDRYRRSLGNAYIEYLGEELAKTFKFPIAFKRGPTREGSVIFGGVQIYVDASPFLSNVLKLAGIAYTGSRTLNELQKFFSGSPLARAALNNLFASIKQKLIEATDMFAQKRQLTVEYIKVHAKQMQKIGKRVVPIGKGHH